MRCHNAEFWFENFIDATELIYKFAENEAKCLAQSHPYYTTEHRVSRYEIPYLVSKNHVHTSTYGKNCVKTKVIGGHSPDPTQKMAVLGPKKPKNGLI